ncbi:MAG: hypothetical protein SOX97_04705 [Sutterella sp.]|nr:hypothetical protein [Sutterella sp.]
MPQQTVTRIPGRRGIFYFTTISKKTAGEIFENRYAARHSANVRPEDADRNPPGGTAERADGGRKRRTPALRTGRIVGFRLDDRRFDEKKEIRHFCGISFSKPSDKSRRMESPSVVPKNACYQAA